MNESQWLAQFKTDKTVAVIYGGWAAEREVSIRSSEAVISALKAKGYQVAAYDLAEVTTEQLATLDVVFNIVHGRGGEDGHLQALLDAVKVPYTGSCVAASAIGMNKILTKRIWAGMNLPTARYETVTAGADAIEWEHGFPLIVKAANEGSSIGMYRAESQAELVKAIEKAKEYDSDILLEQWLDGREFTIGILNGKALPPIEVRYTQTFYDYEAKYERNDTQYLCPAPIDEARTKALQELSLKAFEAVQCKGWGRIDVMTDAKGNFHLLEVNTVPGMTDHSLVPMAAKAAGYSFEELVEQILLTARLSCI